MCLLCGEDAFGLLPPSRPRRSWSSTRALSSFPSHLCAVRPRRRCKLFRLAETEWKQRGLGDIKILKHKVTGKCRMVMRQEKTLKVVANLMVDPNASLVRWL